MTTAERAIEAITDEAERLGGEANDGNGIVRAVVVAALPGRERVHFDVWFCVCCTLADRAARRQGYASEVERAFTLATAAVAARKS